MSCIYICLSYTYHPCHSLLPSKALWPGPGLAGIHAEGVRSTCCWPFRGHCWSRNYRCEPWFVWTLTCYIYIHVWSLARVGTLLMICLRKKKNSIQHLYIQCTKLDVAMNGMMQRSKWLKWISIGSCWLTICKSIFVHQLFNGTLHLQPPASSEGNEASCLCSREGWWWY